ncbi:MAG: hypothetical protein WC212_06635 [Candidatus Delongbacteria bacterium]
MDKEKERYKSQIVVQFAEKLNIDNLTSSNFYEIIEAIIKENQNIFNVLKNHLSAYDEWQDFSKTHNKLDGLNSEVYSKYNELSNKQRELKKLLIKNLNEYK